LATTAFELVQLHSIHDDLADGGLPDSALPALSQKQRAILLSRRILGSLILLGDAVAMHITSGVIRGTSQFIPDPANFGYSFVAELLSWSSAAVIYTAVLSWWTGLRPNNRIGKSLDYRLIPAVSIISAVGSFLLSAALFDTGEFAKKPKDEP
jgi:hypothetical protein